MGSPVISEGWRPSLGQHPQQGRLSGEVTISKITYVTLEQLFQWTLPPCGDASGQRKDSCFSRASFSFIFVHISYSQREASSHAFVMHLHGAGGSEACAHPHVTCDGPRSRRTRTHMTPPSACLDQGLKDCFYRARNRLSQVLPSPQALLHVLPPSSRSQYHIFLIFFFLTTL